VLEVDALALHHQRAPLHLGVDCPDILAQNSNRYQLHRAEKEDADDQGSDAHREAVPVQQLVGEVAESRQSAERGRHKPRKGDDAQRHLGEVGNAEHRHVVEGVEVVLALAALARGLIVEDLGVGKADLGDQAAEVRVGIVHGFDDVDYPAVIKPEAGEVFESLDRRQMPDQPVIALANPEHDRVLLAGSLDGQDRREAVFPLSDEFGNELGRILEIRHDTDGGVARGLVERVQGRADVAEVAGVDDDLDVGVRGGDALQDLDRAIR